MTSNEIRIVIGSWGSYNECNERALGSRWFDLSDFDDWDDIEEELKKLNADLAYYEGFLATVEKKLSNEKFVANAPEMVVAIERKKQSDAQEKIDAIKASIAALTK